MDAAPLPLSVDTAAKPLTVDPLSATLPTWVRAIPFFAIHAACVMAFFVSITPVDWAMCFALYVVRMFGITAVYHRYFAHKSYKTSRWFQFVLAWIGCSSLQKGPLWWAGHHRLHHRYSDTEHDVHSPIVKTVWDAHVGWVLDSDNDPTHWKILPDWSKFPELVWLNTYHWIPGICLGTACFFVSLATGGTGWGGLATFFISTVLLYHGTFLINSMAHLFGNRRYETTDHSRNSLILAIITLGEGWHNNHHHYQAAARQGFFWWEIDMSYYALKALSVVGLVWDLKQPPKKMLAKNFRTVRDIAPLPKSPV